MDILLMIALAMLLNIYAAVYTANDYNRTMILVMLSIIAGAIIRGV